MTTVELKARLDFLAEIIKEIVEAMREKFAKAQRTIKCLEEQRAATLKKNPWANVARNIDLDIAAVQKAKEEISKDYHETERVFNDFLKATERGDNEDAAANFLLMTIIFEKYCHDLPQQNKNLKKSYLLRLQNGCLNIIMNDPKLSEKAKRNWQEVEKLLIGEASVKYDIRQWKEKETEKINIGILQYYKQQEADANFRYTGKGSEKRVHVYV